MTKAGASERALKAAEEVRSLAMNYFGYATATGDTNEVYQKFPVTGVAAIIDAEFPAGDRRKGERREGSSSGADKDYCLADGSYCRKSERRKNTTEQVRKLREALEPFAAFAENYVDPEGWNDVGISASHDRVVDWFGPSDFRQVRTALAGSEVEKDNVKGKGSIPLVEWHSHVPA